MQRPRNTKLPFFAYGLFKPGQLCYSRIKNFVKTTQDCRVTGDLYERDGIPVFSAALIDNNREVEGFRIEFSEGKGEIAYQSICDIEPGDYYEWREIKFEDEVKGNVLAGIGGKTPDFAGARRAEWPSWDGRKDPYFSAALGLIDERLERTPEKNGDIRETLELQMLYQLLWTSIERFCTLKYSFSAGPMQKIRLLSEDESFRKVLRERVTRKHFVFRTNNGDKETLDPARPRKSIDYYYAVRSNSVHRGKAVYDDYNILRPSLQELLVIFKTMLDVDLGPLPKRGERTTRGRETSRGSGHKRSVH